MVNPIRYNSKIKAMNINIESKHRVLFWIMDRFFTLIVFLTFR
jgi:hypothetical protein